METTIQRFLLLSLGTSLLLQSCAPVFSELQSARTVGKNRLEVTPSYSAVVYSEDGENTWTQEHLGIQAAYGISSKVDIRLRYEHIWAGYGEENVSVNIVGIGPKFSLVENDFAVYLPIGRALGEFSEKSWQMHPTLLFTIPAIKDKLDITLSPKYLLVFNGKGNDLVAANLGLSFSSNINRWAIRPEYGILFKPSFSGHYSHFSLGFSVAFGK